MLRVVGHVVLGVRPGLAIGARVSPQDRKITGMPRPHPVVDLTAKLADRRGRRVDQTDILEFQVGDPSVRRAAEKRSDLAAPPRSLGITYLHQLPPFGPQRLASRPFIADPGSRRQDLLCNVVDALNNANAAALRRLFLGAGPGDKAVLQEVSVDARAGLERRVSAVVIGDHQALRRHKRGRATVEIDRRSEQAPARRIPEFLGRALEPALAERLVIERRNLLGHPLPLVRARITDLRCDHKREQEEGRAKVRKHTRGYPGAARDMRRESADTDREPSPVGKAKFQTQALC